MNRDTETIRGENTPVGGDSEDRIGSGLKALFIWPSAEFSTYDVANGINKALLAEDVELYDYRLNRHIQMCSLGLGALYAGQDSSGAALIHGSEAILHNAVLHGCRLAFFVNGMGLHPDALLTLHRCGIKIVGWFTESPYDTNRDKELRLAQLCDLAFVNERTALDSFPCPAVYLPHAYDPEVHYPALAGTPDDRAVTMVGTGFMERQLLFEMIDWTGIDLRLGGLWMGISEPSHLAKYLVPGCLPNEATVSVYHQSAIVLNPHRYHLTAESANPRVFEVAACGRLQISDYRREIDEIFDGAVPMYTPGVPYELEGLIRHYLAHDDERQQLAARAWKAVQPHTFKARARTIIPYLRALV